MKTKDAFRNSKHYKQSIPDLILIPYIYKQLLTKLLPTATHMKIQVFWDIVFVIRQIDVSTECSAFMFKVKQSSWTA
jgi:hypothetical protein